MIHWINLMTWLAMAPSPAANGEQPPAWTQFTPFIIIFVMFYFVLIRPQAKKQKEHDALLKTLKSGDKVIAAGGIYGVISNVKDNTVTLRIAEGVKIEIQRSSIATVLKDSESVGS